MCIVVATDTDHFCWFGRIGQSTRTDDNTKKNFTTSQSHNLEIVIICRGMYLNALLSVGAGAIGPERDRG